MNELNIVYTVDDGFLPLVSVSLISIQENNPKSNLNVYIATEKNDLTENFQRLVKHHSNDNTKIHFLDCKKYDSDFEKLNMNRWGSLSFYIYWRLVAFDLLEVDKAIYVDSDVLCYKEVEWPNLNGKVAGSVLDSVHSCYNKYLNISPSFPLYNTGTLFVDVKKWKDKKCTQKIINYIYNVKSQFMMADQDLFSLAIKDDVEIISPRYNWFAGYDYYGIQKTYKIYDLHKKDFYSKEELNSTSKDIIFYHCLDGVFGRPWFANNDHPAKKQFNYYRERSAWPNYIKNSKQSLLFKIEKTLEKILPENIYCVIHNYAIQNHIHKNAQKM